MLHFGRRRLLAALDRHTISIVNILRVNAERLVISIKALDHGPGRNKPLDLQGDLRRWPPELWYIQMVGMPRIAGTSPGLEVGIRQTKTLIAA
jgi:hypothetical protein